MSTYDHPPWLQLTYMTNFTPLRLVWCSECGGPLSHHKTSHWEFGRCRKTPWSVLRATQRSHVCLGNCFECVGVFPWGDCLAPGSLLMRNNYHPFAWWKFVCDYDFFPPLLYYEEERKKRKRDEAKKKLPPGQTLPWFPVRVAHSLTYIIYIMA